MKIIHNLPYYVYSLKAETVSDGAGCPVRDRDNWCEPVSFAECCGTSVSSDSIDGADALIAFVARLVDVVAHTREHQRIIARRLHQFIE